MPYMECMGYMICACIYIYMCVCVSNPVPKGFSHRIHFSSRGPAADKQTLANKAMLVGGCTV